MISTRMLNLIMMAFPITGWSTYFLPGTDIEIIHKFSISAEYMFLYIGRYKTLHISRQYKPQA